MSLITKDLFDARSRKRKYPEEQEVVVLVRVFIVKSSKRRIFELVTALGVTMKKVIF
jgi:hypothetical protein